MNTKTLNALCNEAQRQNLPLLFRRRETITMKWSDPPRPQASFGFINDWVDVGDEIKGAFGRLVIPFQTEKLGWVKRETIKLFRFDSRKKRFEHVDEAILHPKSSVVYASIDKPGTYGLIGLHSHPLVRETIRLLCEMKPMIRALPADQQRKFRDRTCEVILCANDMDRFFTSREGLKELASDYGISVPDRMPEPLSRPARAGETICDRCHGVDIIDLPDCHVLEPLPDRRCRQVSWESVGPKHISGAMRQIVVDPTDRRRLYAVSANGGVWRLTNVDEYPAAEVWQPLTDALTSLRFRTLAVAPSNGRTLYAANSVKELDVTPIEVYSEIYRSRSRGRFWRRVHQDGMGVVHRLVVHPANANVVFAATSTGLWRKVEGELSTWTNLFPDDCLDVALDPDDSSIIYLGVRNRGIFKSFTSGADWTTDPILDFIAANANNRRATKIALGRRNSDGTEQTSTSRTVVVRFGDEVCTNQSSGSGAWQRVTIVSPANDVAGGNRLRSDTFPNQRDEWVHCLAVDPFDPAHILVGAIALFESTDGGATWNEFMGPHEDVHSLTFDPEIRDLVYFAGDGGLFSSIDGGTTWPTMRLSHTNPAAGRGLNLAMGLVTSEFDHSVVRSGRCVATIDHTGFILSENFENRWQFLFNGPDNSARHAHENGYVFPCPVTLDRYYIFNLRAGDDPLSIPDNPATPADESVDVVGRLAQFDFTRTGGLVNAPATPFTMLSPFSAFDPPQGQGLPNNQVYKPEVSIYQENLFGPFAARFSEPNDERLLLFGTVNLPGVGFTIQSLRLATNGTTVTATATEATHATEPFLAMTFVPNDPDRAFAITQRGQLFERDFSAAGQFTAAPQWNIPANDLFVSRLIAVTRPSLKLYAISQHAIGCFDDDSTTWVTLHIWDEPNESLMSLVAHPTRDDTLFLGTSRGVYLSDNGGHDWQPYHLDLPAVPITQLSFDQGYLYAATFGRGLWRCRPCPR